MNGQNDFFNGKYIYIDNIIKPEISEIMLHVTRAGHFTPDNCPRQKKKYEKDYFFMIVTQGKGIVKYNNTLHNVSAGECVFIDCSQPNHYLPDPDDPWGVTWINLNGPSAEYYYKMILKFVGNIFIPQNFEIIRVLLSKTVDNNLHKTESKDVLNAKLVTDLLTAVILNNKTYDDCTNRTKHKLFSIREHIDNNFTDDINLDVIAKTFYISKYYLTREFKKTFGTTITQYTLNKRIEYAKELLTYTNKSIEEISDACGFKNQSYFSKQFKKSENMTCLAYRKKYV